MYFSKIPEGGSAEDFVSINVADRVFYTEKIGNTSTKGPVRRRLSDQFKDPSFIVKDTFRKLNMIKAFKVKHSNIDVITEKYISCIQDCIWELKKDFEVDPKSIFQAFDLKRLGINSEDFGVGESEYVSDTE